MLSDNHWSSVANQVAASNNSSLFTTGATGFQTKTGMATSSAHQKYATPNIAKMSMASNFAGSRQVQRMTSTVEQLGAPQASSSNLFGAPAPVAQSQFSKFAAAPQRSTQINMSMFESSNPSQTKQDIPASIMGPLENSANMIRASQANSTKRGKVIMMATATVEGDTNVKVIPEHLDRIFLTNKFDNPKDWDDNLKYAGNKYAEELMKNAEYLSGGGKGVLASDESNKTCGARLVENGIEDSVQMRNDWRECLYTTPNLSDSVSGVIMFDETIRQSTASGVKFTKYLADQGILTGIKVDIGITPMEGTNGEGVTNGLDGLLERAQEYYEMGARFAKWRAVLQITPDGLPSDAAIHETAYSLARYAQICQRAGLVPVVEPEILTDGEHDIRTCARMTEKVQDEVVRELKRHNILLEGMLLKPNMVTAGAQAAKKATPQEVAFFTVRTLERTMPAAVPGITFLSGGQSEEIASQNLNAINQLANGKHPWNMTFSFGRALQSSVLKIWGGKAENKEAAQKRLSERVVACSQAAKGVYEGGAGSTDSDYVQNYVY